jgi:hypothetical protein
LGIKIQGRLGACSILYQSPRIRGRKIVARVVIGIDAEIGFYFQAGNDGRFQIAGPEKIVGQIFLILGLYTVNRAGSPVPYRLVIRIQETVVPLSVLDLAGGFVPAIKRGRQFA